MTTLAATSTLSASAAVSAVRASQQYCLLMQPTFAAQNDTIAVLANLVAVTLAARASQKSLAIGMLNQVVEIATLLLGELYGMQQMPLSRPDNDQVTEFVRSANAGRSVSSTPSLPPLTPLPAQLKH
jgi:hypothetical protein